MPELDDVRIGETIAVEWGNAIRDRTIQRYANAAERAELHPNPTEGDLSYLEDTNSIEVFDGFAWVAGIPNQAVTTPKLADGAVTTDKIAQEAVTTSRIANEAVTWAKIAPGAVSSSKIGAGQVATGNLADGAVTTAKIAPGAIVASRIADGVVSEAKLASQAVTGPKIAPEAVTFSRIAGNAIAAFERSGATVETSVNVPSSVGNLATVTLNIPSSWSSWNCVAFAQAAADNPTLGAARHLALSVRIDGTDGSPFDYGVQGASTVAAVAASFRSGITTTGNRTIALRGISTTGGVTLVTVFLYARAFRTS